MIVRDKPNLLHLFFIVQGSIVPRVMPHLIFISMLSICIVFVREQWPTKIFAFDGAPFSLVGIALSIFLGFRNSACYDRWWEGRRAWGQFTLSCRTLARQTIFLRKLGKDAGASRSKMIELCYHFAHALVDNLQPEGPYLPNRHRSEPAEPISSEAPDWYLNRITTEFSSLRLKGVISDHDYQMLSDTVRDMAHVQVTGERLKNTPLPFGYTLLLHRTAYAFCFLIPFGFADTLAWGTPVVTALIAYTFFGLDALGDELEDPFGQHPNTLAVRSIATNIETEMKMELGDPDLPAAPKPIDHVLI